MSLGGTDMVSKNNHQFYQQKHAERKQRWGIRKLSVGVASVLLGTTFMLYGNHAVLADTVTSPSDDVTRSTTTQGGNKDKVTEGTTSTPQTTEEATNHQDTPQGQNPTQGQDTTQNTTNVDKKDTEVTPTNDATTLATQKTTAKFTAAKFKVPAARLEMKVVNPTSTDLTTEEASTSLPMSNQDIELVPQPMLTEIINKPKDNWVYKNMKWYPGASTAEVKEILQNHTTKDESGRYYFAGAANYNESYHVVYLLARSNNLNGRLQ